MNPEPQMNPARQAFEDELDNLLIDACNGITTSVSTAADRLIERARRVIIEE